ncbi:TetR/AcrR family transcriptional regulator [Flavobacterium branchiophilum]|uniref:TetR/AcrR family transcriptional regulator n=2 Tax=Flavobacterium branchiophilum TaxID=55197 RepID=A0A2H3K8E8_9FLAO|nr:TetR/AcrR family transcriptional regulator [Flavobacterium branchiophilum]PDS21830.1 TetR/AcrR family transcriptional regulator [Flavobacterium branchiophilum]CCB69282.1 Probable transcriptional regulator, TetR family [Flavobacterium branchiophilum FL-15]
MDRKSEIIQVASKLFHEKGYSAVTVRDIAQYMGIKASSLYNHIKSKQEILVEIIIQTAQKFTFGMQSIIASESNAIQKLEQIIALHIEISVENSDYLACLNNDWMHLHDHDLQEFIKMRNLYEQNLRQIIKNGIEKGEIQNLDVEVILFSILSTLRSIYLWYYKNNSIDTLILTQNITKILLKGIV